MAMGIRKHYKKRKKNISGEHQVLLLVEQDYQEQEGNLKPDTGVKKAQVRTMKHREKQRCGATEGRQRQEQKQNTWETNVKQDVEDI